MHGDILGLSPIILSTLLVVGGVGLHTGLGWLQSSLPPNPKKIVASIIIGTITSFALVTPIVHQLLVNPGPPYIEFATIIGALATIAGIDQLVKNTGKAIIAKKQQSKLPATTTKPKV